MSEETDEEIELRVFDGADSNSSAAIADIESTGHLRIQFDSPFDLPLQEGAMELAPGYSWDVLRRAYLSRILEAPVDDPEESMVECWQEIIRERQRENPFWKTEWVASYGADGFSMLSNAESKALFGVTIDHLRSLGASDTSEMDPKTKFRRTLEHLVEAIICPFETRFSCLKGPIIKPSRQRRQLPTTLGARGYGVPKRPSPLHNSFTPDNMEESPNNVDGLSSVADELSNHRDGSPGLPCKRRCCSSPSSPPRTPSYMELDVPSSGSEVLEVNRSDQDWLELYEEPWENIQMEQAVGGAKIPGEVTVSHVVDEPAD